MFDTKASSDTDEDTFDPPPTKKKKTGKRKNSQPLIIAACTPLMARVHQSIRQAEELIFCDSTSSLERYNCSLFVLSTRSPAGGLPLAVVITSDEKENTIKVALEKVKEVVPQNSLWHQSGGPKVIMTDDSATERGALADVWPDACLLLCTFHFLQSRWTWLYDSKNKIKNEHRRELIGKVKELVYAKSEKQLLSLYEQFRSSELLHIYPQFLQHMETLWPRRREWAWSYRETLPIRGNHTNNIAEAGIRIVKDIVFGRIKAYNLVQMFQFVTEALEIYYKRRLLSVAHNRFDHFIAKKYKGFNAHAIPVDKIHKRDDSPFQFIVGSKSDPSVTYDVDMELGACSCPQGRDGSPCVHQAAVTLHFQSPSFNFIPTLHPSMRRDIAIVALGEQAEKDLAFYSSLHQQENEKSVSNTTTTPNTTDEPDFTRSCWDLIHGGTLDDDDDDDTVTHSTQPLLDQERKITLESQIESLSQSLKFGLESNDPHLITGIEKFLKRYTELSQLPSSGRLASAMHNFSSKERDGVALAPLKCGLLRRGKRIGVQATATVRRKYGTRGKAPAQPGRPCKQTLAIRRSTTESRYIMPVRARNQVQKKRLHSLAHNIRLGQQNAGKW